MPKLIIYLPFLLLIDTALLVSAKIHKTVLPFKEEFQFESSPSGFLMSGEFVKVEGSEEKEQWLCIDYSFDSKAFNASSLINRPYPEKECGGAMKTSENAYWFALKAKWYANGSVDVDFSNILELKVRSASMFESQSANANRFQWKLAVEAQPSSPTSTVYFNGLGDVEVPPLTAQPVNVRLPKNGFVQVGEVSSPLNPVVLDQLPNYHLLSEILKGDETVLKVL